VYVLERLANRCFPDATGYGPIIHLAAPTDHAVLHDEEAMYDFHLNMTAKVAQLSNELMTDLVLASSGKVYGTPKINSLSLVAPTTILGKAKFMAEQIASTICEQHVAVARIFNVFGPGQRKGYLIPDILKQVAEGKTTIELRNSAVLRDFIYVHVVAKAISVIARNVSKMRTPSEIHNIASGTPRTPASLVLDIGRILSKRLAILPYSSEPPKNELSAEIVIPSRYVNTYNVWSQYLKATVIAYPGLEVS